MNPLLVKAGIDLLREAAPSVIPELKTLLASRSAALGGVAAGSGLALTPVLGIAAASFAAGAAVGVVMAPTTGAELRQRLVQRVRRVLGRGSAANGQADDRPQETVSAEAGLARAGEGLAPH